MNQVRTLPVVDVGDDLGSIAPKSKEHLAIYCANIFNVIFPYPSSDEEYCVKNNHKSPLDAMWAAYAEEDDFLIWYAMRGTGKTFDLALLSFLESAFKPQCGINILGGSLEQSTKAIAYLKDLWEYPSVPRHLLCGNEVAGRGCKLTNGSWITALAASTKSVRGPHPQKLRLDEVDEMDSKIYEAAKGQPKMKCGIRDNIIVSSTLHNPFGLMSEIIDNRVELGAELYAWCVNEVIEPKGFWTLDEIQRRKKQLTKAMWEAEYELKRPKLGETIFDFDSVDRAYNRGRFDIINKNNIIEAGIDWGYSCTVLNLIEDMKNMYKNSKSFGFEYIELNDRCQKIADICIEYNISKIYCDCNPKDSNITLTKILKERGCSTVIIPIAFNKWKDIGINILRFLFENDVFNITDKTCQDKCKKYHYKNADLGIIAKEDDHYPDSLIAWASSKYELLGYNIDKNKKK